MGLCNYGEALSKETVSLLWSLNFLLPFSRVDVMSNNTLLELVMSTVTKLSKELMQTLFSNYSNFILSITRDPLKGI